MIVHLQNDRTPGSFDAPDSPGWPIHPGAAPRGSEVVIRKSGDDGFEGTELGVTLRRAGVERVAVAGLLSEMCFSATIRAAVTRGFDVVLVSDAHATYDLDDIPSQAVSRVAEHALGDSVEIMPTAGIIFVQPHR